jgi:hypothetical protein
MAGSPVKKPAFVPLPMKKLPLSEKNSLYFKKYFSPDISLLVEYPTPRYR